MKLLHPEVEIAPGTPGKKFATPTPEREKMSGSVILRLTNETAQENAYTISLRCDNPFWQESWYTITSWIATGNNTPGGKADVPGHNGRRLKVFVPHGGTRDIFIRFNVPKTPESRAGRYDYTIEVETQITTPQDGMARRKDRLTSIPAVANVRPYYVWSLDLTPEQQRVTRRRRTGEFEVVVTNEGNDWLYCDLQLPRPKDLLLDAPTLRLAVPPPEPGELLPSVGIQEGRPGTQRVVPLLATTRLKLFRGDLTPQPLAVSAQRVHAPSLPPPAEDGYLSLGSVVAMPPTPTEAPQAAAPTDRALVYAPPVPAKFVDFFSRGAGNIRSWIAPLLALMVMASMIWVLYQQFFNSPHITKKGYTFRITNLNTQGGPLYIAGTLIVYSHYTLKDAANNQVDEGTIKPDKRDKAHPDPSKGVITIPKQLPDGKYLLTVRRLGLPTFLASIVPKEDQEIELGNGEPPAVLPIAGQVIGGQTLDIPVQNIGNDATVTVGGKPATVIKANPKPGTITVKVATDIPTSSQCPITVTPPGGVPISPIGPLPSGISKFDFDHRGVILVPRVTQKASGSHQARQTFRVRISGFMGQGTASLNGASATPVEWTSEYVTLTVPSGKPGTRLAVVLQPAGGGNELSAGEITIGAGPPPTPTITQSASGSYRVGQTFRVGISGFPGPGVATLNGSPATPTEWTGDHVTFTVPPGDPGINLIVKLQPTGGGAVLPAGQVSIKAPFVLSVADYILKGDMEIAKTHIQDNNTPFNKAVSECLQANTTGGIKAAFTDTKFALEEEKNVKNQAALYYVRAEMYRRNANGALADFMIQDSNADYKSAKKAASQGQLSLPPLK